MVDLIDEIFIGIRDTTVRLMQKNIIFKIFGFVFLAYMTLYAFKWALIKLLLEILGLAKNIDIDRHW